MTTLNERELSGKLLGAHSFTGQVGGQLPDHRAPDRLAACPWCREGAGPSSCRTPGECVPCWGSLHPDLQQLPEGATGCLILLMR